MTLLILNSGSSSLRFQLISAKNLKCLYKGHIDGIGLKTCQYSETIDSKNNIKNITCKNHTQALKIGLNALLKTKTIDSFDNIKAIGHRVVHGGEKYITPVLINKITIKEIKQLNALAPLHNPANLEGISACLKILKNKRNIAIFDTAFHGTMPEKAFLYGLPYSLYQKYQIRRYGFHGTSHKYVSGKAIEYLKKKKLPHAKIICCHLGNGCSITAIEKGESIDTSMGFTPLEGAIMGTRSGDIDPGIPYFLSQKLKKSPKKLNEFFNHECGIKAVSEISSDIRRLRDAWFLKQDKKAKRALDLFCYRIAKYIGSYAAALNGLDALIFTAGIGENAEYIREWICEYLTYLNLKISKIKNKNHSFEISEPKSKLKVLVITTNEELQIAKEVINLLKKT